MNKLLQNKDNSHRLTLELIKEGFVLDVVYQMGAKHDCVYWQGLMDYDLLNHFILDYKATVGRVNKDFLTILFHFNQTRFEVTFEQGKLNPTK